MDYITTKEAAAKWTLAERTIQNYCANEKIPGAKSIGGQWFIPIDARQPIDRRTKAAEECGDLGNYKFPVFVYTRYYRDSSELTHDEQCLLRAQTLHLEGDFVQSIKLCKELLEKKPLVHVTAGAYLTIGFDSLLLGLITEHKYAISQLENITAAESSHKSDFELMISVLKYYSSWDSSNITRIQPCNLSSDAVWYYKLAILTISVLSTRALDTNYLRSVESECLIYEKFGMSPILYVVLCVLGISKDLGRTREEKESCLRRGIKLAIDNNWTGNLSRFYNLASESIERIVGSYGGTYLNTLQKMHKTTINNWNIFHRIETGMNHVGQFSFRQIEILLLVSYGYTDKEIAICFGLSEGSTKNELKELMKIVGSKNKAQLRAYAGKYFDSSFNTTNNINTQQNVDMRCDIVNP